MTLDEAKRRYPPLWVIYDHPTDYPDKFVARLWYGEYPTSATMIAPTLEMLQEQFSASGMVKIERDPNNDQKIVETWL